MSVVRRKFAMALSSVSKILVQIDGSKPSMGAADLVIDLARRYSGAKLRKYLMFN